MNGAVFLLTLVALPLAAAAWPVRRDEQPQRPYDQEEKEEEEVICYMGHVDCYDDHYMARLCDEADWEAERWIVGS